MYGNPDHPYSQQSQRHHMTSFVGSRSFQVAVNFPNTGFVYSVDSLHTLPNETWLQIR